MSVEILELDDVIRGLEDFPERRDYEAHIGETRTTFLVMTVRWVFDSSGIAVSSDQVRVFHSERSLQQDFFGGFHLYEDEASGGPVIRFDQGAPSQTLVIGDKVLVSVDGHYGLQKDFFRTEQGYFDRILE